MKSYDVTIHLKALCLYLQNGVMFFSKFHKIKSGNLVEICFWLNLAVKGLIKKWMHALEKPDWREKEKLTRPEVRAAVTS